MPKDPRYEVVKYMIDTGKITSLSQIFQTLPKSRLARDSGINYIRLLRLLQDPNQFTIKEVSTISKMFNVDKMKMVMLMYKQIESNGLKNKKVRSSN